MKNGNRTTEQQNNRTTEQQNNRTTEQQNNRTTEQQNNRTTEQQNNRTTEQQNNRTTEQQNNRTTEQQNNRTTEQSTIKNRTIFCGDNLDILRGFNNNSIDLIYLDPPFNKKKQFTAPIGSTADGASFKDYWEMEDLKDAWLLLLKEKHEKLYQFLNLSSYIGDKSNKYYLIYMAVRLLELHRVLKETGTLYLHCDSTMGHYLKLLLDVIFGHENFRNEIIWKRQSAKKGSQYKKKTYGSSSDHIFFYTKSSKYYFDIPKTEVSGEELDLKFSRKDENGRYFRTDHITRTQGLGIRDNLIYEYKGYTPKKGWMMGKEKLQQMDEENRLYWSKNGKPYRKYFKDEYDGKEVSNIWVDISVVKQKERVGYPTQKPVELLERLISASCPRNGIILDPFCGCATTCVASENLLRKWIGIDISQKAYDLLKERLNKEVKEEITDKDNDDNLHLYGSKIDLIFRKDIPDRTDLAKKKLSPVIRKELKKDLYGQQTGNCKGCEQHFIIQVMEIDHIIPKSKGGSDQEDNLQLLCSYCNRVKGNRSMEELKLQLQQIREQTWGKVC